MLLLLLLLLLLRLFSTCRYGFQMYCCGWVHTCVGATQVWALPSDAALMEWQASVATSAAGADDASGAAATAADTSTSHTDLCDGVLLQPPYPPALDQVLHIRGHQTCVWDVCIVGNVVLSGSGDGTVKVWDFSTGVQLTTLRHQRSECPGPAGRSCVRRVCVFRDMIVTATSNPNSLAVRRRSCEWGGFGRT